MVGNFWGAVEMFVGSRSSPNFYFKRSYCIKDHDKKSMCMCTCRVMVTHVHFAFGLCVCKCEVSINPDDGVRVSVASVCHCDSICITGSHKDH